MAKTFNTEKQEAVPAPVVPAKPDTAKAASGNTLKLFDTISLNTYEPPWEHVMFDLDIKRNEI
jgi:hypothetical protein